VVGGVEARQVKPPSPPPEEPLEEVVVPELLEPATVPEELLELVTLPIEPALVLVLEFAAPLEEPVPWVEVEAVEALVVAPLLVPAGFDEHATQMKGRAPAATRLRANAMPRPTCITTLLGTRIPHPHS
jgi:hypothetical protein